MESWRYQDPAKVYERIQAQERSRAARSEKSKSEIAREELEKLFKNFDDGERPNEQK